jgi:hypothetical protein
MPHEGGKQRYLQHGGDASGDVQQVLDNPDAAKALEHPALKPLLDSAAD